MTGGDDRSAVRSVRLEVRRVGEGWTTVTFREVERVGVTGAPAPDGEGLLLTLVGVRSGEPNQVETGVLSVADRHEPLLDSPAPTLPGVSDET